MRCIRLIVVAMLVGLLEHVVHAVLLKRHILQLAGVLHAQHERYRGVLDRGSLGPSYGLHTGNARNARRRPLASLFNTSKSAELRIS